MRARWLLISIGLVAARAEIIDRIAVTIDNLVITESEVVREIRLTALLNGDELDLSPDARRKAADRLVEQKLIRKEIELGRYVEPAPAEVEPLLQQIRAQRFQTPQQYTDALKKYGITEQDLKAHLLWQTTLIRFIDVRFRPGIQISDDEIRQYSAKQRPAVANQAGPDGTVDLDGVREKIEQALISERIDKQMDEWLQETKKRAKIEFRAEAFQ